MSIKVVYQTDCGGVYIGETDARESPLEPGVYLIPGGCVETAPPEIPEGYIARWTGDVWELVEVPQEPAPEPPTLAEMAAVKSAALQAEKCRVRDGGFLVDGILFDSDQAARVAYLELAMRFSTDAAFTTNWKASQGTWVTMDAALFTQVQAEGTAHIQAVFAWQVARDAEVAAVLTQVTAGTMTEADASAAVEAIPTTYSPGGAA